jgi:hypothetical protein
MTKSSLHAYLMQGEDADIAYLLPLRAELSVVDVTMRPCSCRRRSAAKETWEHVRRELLLNDLDTNQRGR